MNMIQKICFFVCLFGGILTASFVSAQITEQVYGDDYRIRPEMKKTLTVEFDNLSFFKNNEYSGPIQKGYTLPGGRLVAKAIYFPSERVKLEAGIYGLHFWGADKYPNLSFRDIAVWKGDQYSKGFHLLPWFRTQIALSDHVDLVIGNIYGSTNHHLIEPLYNKELELTADPEAGLQVLWHAPVADIDVWTDWRSFIFYEDTHQEMFFLGFSSRLKLNDPSSVLHVYVPIQGLAQHRGGEIDTIRTHSVQTLMNGALGAGMEWNVGKEYLKRIGVEADLSGYYQQAGKLWPVDKGHGFHVSAKADTKYVRVKTSFWTCHDFVSLLGHPFYGSVSTVDDDVLLKNPQMWRLGVEYAKTVTKGVSIGVEADLYFHTPVTVEKKGGILPEKKGYASFSAGIYVRIVPSARILHLKE